MSSRFSVGEIISGSRVYITTKLDNFQYFAYETGNTVTFKSLDPEFNIPPLFTVIINDEGIAFIGPSGKYWNINLVSLVTEPSFFQFTSQYSLSKYKLYGGVYYTTVLAYKFQYGYPPSTSVPFGGYQTSIYPAPLGPAGGPFMFVPVSVPTEGTALPTPYSNVGGICTAATDINYRVSQWMKGLSVGCDSINQCIFTSRNMCETEYIPPYCSPDQYCGFCLGACSNSNKICVYDYSTSNIPHYSCDPIEPTPVPPTPTPIPPVPPVPTPIPPVKPEEKPDPTFWEQYQKQIVIGILIILVLIIIGVFIYGARHPKNVPIAVSTTPIVNSSTK